MLNRAVNIVLGLTLLLAPLAGWGQPNGWHYNSGNLLRAVKFIGQEGWVVGSLGHIMHTTDGGESWKLQVSGTSNDILSVSFINNQTGWVGGTSGILLQTTDSGRSWIPKTAPTGRNINIFFIDASHGWITSGIDSIFRTTNGGLSWEVHPSGLGFGGWWGVVFLDSLLGWTSGGGFILKSTDGGISWTRVATLTDAANSICMVDSLYGWAVWAPGKAYHTRDGWQTWVEQPINSPCGLYGVSFEDTATGIACGGDGGAPATICRTTNAGSIWIIDSSLARGDNAFYGIDGQFQPNWALVVGAAGGMVKTTNGGTTWRVLRNTDIGNTSLLNVAFYDPNSGWSTGTNGVITHTINGGTVWTRQVSGTSSFLYGVDFPSSQHGWICTGGGGVLGTTNGGNNWIGEPTGNTYPLFSIDFVDTAYGVAVGGYYGPPDPPKPFGSNDSLKQWGTGLDFWKYPWRPEETLLQTPYRAIVRTTNGGALWIAVNSTGQVPLYGVSFVTPREGWACGDPQGGMGVILHTTDSGATWTGQLSNVNQGLYWIQFRDRFHGWTVGNAGTALWTTDGGTTWNQGNTGTTLQFLSCAFYDTLGGFACGGNGTLFKTTDGGRNWQTDTSKTYANLMTVNALDSTHAWSVGSYGMVLGWRLAGTSGVEQGSTGAGELRVKNGIKAWPNPFVSFARVPGREKDKFALYDVTGRKMGVYPGSQIGADVGAGVYFLMAEGKEGRPTRIVKVR